MKKVTMTFIVDDALAKQEQDCLDNLELGYAASEFDLYSKKSECSVKDYYPEYEGKIEVLYATDIDDNTKTMVLAMPYHNNVSLEFARKNLETFFGTKNIDERIIKKVCTGEQFSCDGYDFGWETVEFEC